MKWIFLVLVFCLGVQLQAREHLVEGTAAYFLPTSKIFRTIYTSRVMWGAEYNCQAWRSIYGWMGANYYSSSGRSIGLNHKTDIFFVPVFLGLKLITNYDRVNFYLGLGAIGNYVHIRDHSPFVIPTSCNWTFGGIVKSGFLITIRKGLFIDLFADYKYTQVDFDNTGDDKVARQTGNLSGWSFGGGIGYRFGCRSH